ncbi:MAG TPA: galactose-1-phosphate uridylyltransferase [Candidatus Binatia bacterium]|nr:galactose-1-phosphate uridylyltransferase [Candidatus Binatia bacterium]
MRPDDLDALQAALWPDLEVVDSTTPDGRSVRYYRSGGNREPALGPEVGRSASPASSGLGSGRATEAKEAPAAPGLAPMALERRWNPVLGEWVINAAHRQERTFLPRPEACPLCPTRPGGPPTELQRPDFEIAVFENRFPSLVPGATVDPGRGTPLTPVAAAAGACEVVVYSPDHRAELAGASLRHLRHLIWVWAERTVALGARPEVAYVFPFENRGEAIGVTLHHPHGQIYAYPMIPPVIAREVASARGHDAATGRCLWCDLLAQEEAARSRLVAVSPTWVAGVPFFARWPYEVHLLPRRHVGSLAELGTDEVGDLARCLKAILGKYDARFGFPLPYVMAVHGRPTEPGFEGPYHLHLEFYPPHRRVDRLKYLAGSELGAGVFINDTFPEATAAELRALPPLDPAGLAEDEV